MSEQTTSATLSEPFPRRILLVVTGLSPQVVTETLYALALDCRPSFIPTEVHLLTTREGAERARLTLLSDDPGWFARLCRDYRLDSIDFGEHSIHVLTDDAGEPLDDIREAGDNACAADAITEKVRELTEDPAAALHVSIAGGRKTMGFFAAYALSLFGRPQDRLSHVLVSAPFESNQGFFYPTPKSHVIYTPPPDTRPLDAKDAVVTLAEIPFVRMREGLPAELLEGRATYRAAVRAAQSIIEPPELLIDRAARRIRAGGTVISLPPAELAFLCWFARRRKERRTGLPCPPDGVSEKEYADAFLAEYRRIAESRRDPERTERALRQGMDKAYFESHKSKLNRLLAAKLGWKARTYQVRGSGRRPATTFCLDLPPDAIRFCSFTEERPQASDL